ncbi:Prolamin-like domain [Arabidopsis thaliana x Arabidopsis arenosa]|uniref:Prolamin-like domain n=1 Tax=Arabidopsis thaliana x Arabidopsis arenosa TaxID=1240361 RepID=A0A8T2AYG5_9BRAS|nr:Prolamin-like domain [Arabidopsis thaliana x Arabidopsis arenosa]
MILLSFSHPTLAIQGDNDEPLLISDDEFEAIIAMSPTSDDFNENVGRKYSKTQKDYLKNCTKKMDVPEQCIEEVLADIIQNKSVSRDCCRGIVRAGKECHMEWMRLFFQIYQLKDFSSKRFSKTNEIWNRCSTEIGAVSPFSG